MSSAQEHAAGAREGCKPGNYSGWVQARKTQKQNRFLKIRPSRKSKRKDFRKNTLTGTGNCYGNALFYRDFPLHVWSVFDPNTFNFDHDRDPEFWSNLDPDPGLCFQFWKKKKEKLIYRETIFLKNTFFKTLRLEELWSQLSLWMMNLCLETSTFSLHLFYSYRTGTKFTCVDPILYSEYRYGSGSTKLLNTDPIRIRITQHCMC